MCEGEADAAVAVSVVAPAVQIIVTIGSNRKIWDQYLNLFI